jgi:hypothetical protein
LEDQDDDDYEAGRKEKKKAGNQLLAIDPV